MSGICKRLLLCACLCSRIPHWVRSWWWGECPPFVPKAFQLARLHPAQQVHGRAWSRPARWHRHATAYLTPVGAAGYPIGCAAGGGVSVRLICQGFSASSMASCLVLSQPGVNGLHRLVDSSHGIPDDRRRCRLVLCWPCRPPTDGWQFHPLLK